MGENTMEVKKMEVKVLLPALLLLVLALGSFVGCLNNPAAPKSSAATSGITVAPTAPGADPPGNKDTDVQEPSYTASIRVPNNDKDNGKDNEADESAQLSKLAKITSEQAKQAALAEVPGKVVKTELDNENGNVVYSVEIDTGSGVKDVKVDAGNGKVLNVEADDPNEHEGERDNDAEDGD